ncbi:hypothetical protein QK887_24825, partial [Salmonella enterica subsp. enterica serovar Oslo]
LTDIAPLVHDATQRYLQGMVERHPGLAADRQKSPV